MSWAFLASTLRMTKSRSCSSREDSPTGKGAAAREGRDDVAVCWAKAVAS